MTEVEKNQFDALSTLWKGAWDQFNERRKYEFQISIAVWTAIGSFSGFLLSKDNLKIDKTFAIGVIIGLIWILVLYFNWTYGLAKANKKDRSKAFHYEVKMQNLSRSNFGVGHQNSIQRTGSSVWILTNWSHGTQIWITCIFTLIAIATVFKFSFLNF